MFLLQSAFHSSRYSPQYQVILNYEKAKYAKILEGMRKNPNVHWRVHDLFNAFTEDYCEVLTLPVVRLTGVKCGNVGSEIIWTNKPPKRLYSACVASDKYYFNILNKMLRQ